METFYLEAFIEKIDLSIFRPKNFKTKVFHNLTKKKKKENGEYCQKVNTQIERSSFTQLPHEITKSFENKVNDFLKKWEDLKVLDKKRANYMEQCMG